MDWKIGDQGKNWTLAENHARILRNVLDLEVTGEMSHGDPWLFVMTCSLGMNVSITTDRDQN